MILGDDEQTEDIIVELFDSMYYSVPNAITYDIVVDNATSISIPNEFGKSSFVIDLSQTEMQSAMVNQLS